MSYVPVLLYGCRESIYETAQAVQFLQVDLVELHRLESLASLGFILGNYGSSLRVLFAEACSNVFEYGHSRILLPHISQTSAIFY